MSMPLIQLSPNLHHSPPYMPESVYWHDYYELSDTAYEWNNGLLEEKPVSDYETYCIHTWFTKLLTLFLQTYPIAMMTGLEMGFRLALPNKVTIRKPDLGVALRSNPVPLHAKDRTYHGIFDLCVESLSDSNKDEIERDTIIKKAEYAAAGVKEYFILHHSPEQGFYRLNAQGVYVPIPAPNGVICSNVLPGFQFRIADLLARPIEEKMLADPVYQRFVLPTWTQERKLWQQDREQLQQEATLRQEAEQRAKTETDLRQQVEQQAQAEIARLKALLNERS